MEAKPDLVAHNAGMGQVNALDDEHGAEEVGRPVDRREKNPWSTIPVQSHMTARMAAMSLSEEREGRNRNPKAIKPSR